MSCADVCIDHDYDVDQNEFHHESSVRARKEHRCCECRWAIKPGDTHELAVGKSDGRFWTMRTCQVCVEIRKAFVCGSWVYGELWESIGEYIFPRWADEGPFDCLVKLDTQQARDRVFDEYEAWVGGGE